MSGDKIKSPKLLDMSDFAKQYGLASSFIDHIWNSSAGGGIKNEF